MRAAGDAADKKRLCNERSARQSETGAQFEWDRADRRKEVKGAPGLSPGRVCPLSANVRVSIIIIFS